MTTEQETIEYWDRQPCNVKHSRHPVGTLEFFEEVEKRRYMVEPHILSFIDAPRWKNKRVLEIGCGMGTDGVQFARETSSYFGMDISYQSIALAHKNFEVRGLKGNFIKADISKIDESSISYLFYDLIYSFGVLHHLEDLCFKTIYKLATTNTVFKFMVYADNSIKEATVRAGLDRYEAQEGCPIVKRYNKTSLFLMLAEVGFRSVSIKQDFIFPYVPELYGQGILKLQPWFHGMPLELIREMEPMFGQHLLVEAVK